MMELRDEFWRNSTDFIAWCEDEELRVLALKVNKELARRLDVLTKKFDKSEASKAKNKKDKIRKMAMGL